MSKMVGEITGTTIKLRPLRREDIEMIRQWRNQDAIRRWFVYREIISAEQQQKWWDKYSLADNDMMFVIERLEDSLPVGAVALYNIVPGEEAEFGRLMIGESCAHGKGYAVEATRLLTDFGINSLGLKKVNLEVFKDNAAAYNVYLKCKYSVVAQQGDMYLMSRCKSE